MTDVSKYESMYEEIVPIDLSVRAIRVNTLKTSVENILERLERKYEIEEIRFCSEGFWVKEATNLIKTVEHNLGYFFIQNASSMIPVQILKPEEYDVVLDIAAAPGAKTTQTAALMNNRGMIVANDVNRERLKSLRGNLQRCGVINTVVTIGRAENFPTPRFNFSRILVDAPCTGTGTMNPRIWRETSQNTIEFFSNLQKKILSRTVELLDNDGILVYSTCSLEPEENEEVIDFSVKRLGMKVEEVHLREVEANKGITEWEDKIYDKSVSGGLRIIPNEKMEGFFVCKLRK